jgi:sterol desaturase/sphingolipid hydroxylase (fatty acid hydroxylase superfamily)
MARMETLDWLSRYLLVLGIPYFLVLIAWELRVLRRPALRGVARGYEWRDSATSMSLGLIKLGMMTLCALYTVPLFAWVHEHRVFTLSPLAWWTWVLLFFADDFTYYWYHRFAHRVRLLWSEHVNHHSSEHYNLSTALRQSTLGPVFIFVYWLPLAWIGFHPAAIAVQFGISLLYQFWIHTEAIGRLGWLEHVLNTPSHHRVHHGSNGLYLDRNYGGILIVWDKLFGTFQPERADVPVRYGLVHDIRTFRLPTVIFHELVHLVRQAWTARGLRNKLGWIFGPPEWSPDGPRWPPDHPRAAAAARVQASSPAS